MSVRNHHQRAKGGGWNLALRIAETLAGSGGAGMAKITPSLRACEGPKDLLRATLVRLFGDNIAQENL